MHTQQKKNGWFFNKNIIDEINSVPEEQVMYDEEAPTKSTPQGKKPSAELEKLKKELAEKEEEIEQLKKGNELEKQRLVRENEQYKQSILRTGEEKAENRRQVQDLENEVRRNRQEIQRLTEENNSGELKIQLEKANGEVTSLKESLEKYKEIEIELKEAKQQYHELTLNQKEEELHRFEKVQTLETQLSQLTAELTNKEEQITQLNQSVFTKEQQIREKEEQMRRLIDDQNHQNAVIEGELVTELQHQIMTLQKENDQMKQESVHSQHEIGEVLISARKQATRMVEKAKIDAQRIIQDSENELQTIQERAKEVSYEVDESRQAILSIYEELKSRVDHLAHNNVPDLEEIKKQYEYPKVSVMSRKDY